MSEIASGGIKLKKTETSKLDKIKAEENDNSLMGALSRAMKGRRVALEENSSDDDDKSDGGSDSDWSD